jgi:hypothetical protein
MKKLMKSKGKGKKNFVVWNILEQENHNTAQKKQA